MERLTDEEITQIYDKEYLASRSKLSILGLCRAVANAQLTKPTSLTPEKAREAIDDYLNKPYEGELARIGGGFKVRLDMRERNNIADFILALFNAQFQLKEGEAQYQERLIHENMRHP